jgi:hypothetical protein
MHAPPLTRGAAPTADNARWCTLPHRHTQSQPLHSHAAQGGLAPPPPLRWATVLIRSVQASRPRASWRVARCRTNSRPTRNGYDSRRTRRAHASHQSLTLQRQRRGGRSLARAVSPRRTTTGTRARARGPIARGSEPPGDTNSHTRLRTQQPAGCAHAHGLEPAHTRTQTQAKAHTRTKLTHARRHSQTLPRARVRRSPPRRRAPPARARARAPHRAWACHA